MDENIKYPKHLIFGICVAFVLLGAFAGMVSATTIYVPDDYSTIQAAVDVANNGDTIIVRNGTYNENVALEKQLSLIGEGTPTIDAREYPGHNGFGIVITVDNCLIKGFRFINGGFFDVETGIEYVGAGIKVTSDGNTIKNCTFENNWRGIELKESSNSTISSNIFNDNGYGIYLKYSSLNNTISENKFEDCGLFALDSYDNQVEGNVVNGKPLIYLENEEGTEITNAGQVILVKCKEVTVRGCNLSCTTVGIELLRSSNCFILNNEICENKKYGIYLSFSSNNSITNNSALNNEYGIYLSSSNNNTLTNDNASNNHVGIYLRHSHNNTLTNTNASNNDYGIDLLYSNNNNIRNNNVSNNCCGIWLYYSSNNFIYRNNFINKFENVDSEYSGNTWNSTEPITYIYNGKTYKNYLGNYWDDYKERYPDAEEIDECGIWDTPYGIDGDNDNYPLMTPWENYFAPTENIFDTGSPANPYPSIMGNHTGAIKPYHTVIATKLYTYSCIGTGGHTEYAEIRNATWNATATWEGYAGDWHSISFEKTVVLLANKTYNYTIRTGSYPQIHHTPALPTANGWINCTKFTDANGHIYTDWIPAIRLE